MKHRTALVTASSIVGVLLAGATAAAANLGILSTTTPDAALGTADPTVAAAPFATAMQPSSVLEQTEPAPVAAQPELLAYEIPQVGVITVERSESSLSVYEVDAPGWQWYVAVGGPDLMVNLTDGTRLIEFTASVVNGEVTVGVADQSVSSRGSDGDDDGSAGADGYDDDRYESDDHEGESHDDD